MASTSDLPYRGEMELPPGPRAPALVQITRWIVQPLELLEDCRRRYGDVFRLRAPRDGSFFVVSDPALIKDVFAADPDVLLAGASNTTLLEPMLGKHSLLTLDGAEHLRERRMLLPAFHGDRMQAFIAVMREITEEECARWPIGKPFSLHPHMQSITLDVILRTVFGLAGGAARKLRADLVELLEIATNPWLLLPGMIGLDPFRVPWLRITRLKQAVDAELYRIIAERRRAPAGGTDVLAMMLEARDEHGHPMTDVEIRDELVTLLLAGHETTATSLAWIFDQLLANPGAARKLRDELAAGRAPYVDAVIRETLRIRPIVPMVGRYVKQPFQLGKWTIPPGNRIAPSIYLTGHRADVYPSPERFDPDRWIGVKPDPYAWLPFGGGTRRCIGMAFAQLEMRVVLETVIPRVRMELADGPARVVRRGITLAPSGGTRVVVRERVAAEPPVMRA